MSEKEDFFGGFADIANELSPHVGGGPVPLDDDGTVVNTGDSHVMIVDPDDVFKDDPNAIQEQEEQVTIEIPPKETDDEEGEVQEEEETEETVVEEEVVEPEVESEDVETPAKVETTEEETTDPEELGEIESDISTYFTEKLAEALGIDIKDEDKFDSASDVVDFMKQLVDDNSKPVYASEEIEKLNEFVQGGGDLKNYFQQSFGDLDLDAIDLTSESTQRSVVREFLKTEGRTEDQIKRRVERYEEAGTLEEEAEDAKELLSEYKTKNAQKLLADQQKLADTHKEQQQKLVDDVQLNIKALKNVRGILVSESEKKQLQNYIFSPDSEGLTEYQKDYAKNVNNLIESAYFTMKGDALIKKIQNKATSTAVKNIKTKLESKGKRTKNVKGQGESSSDLDVLAQASKFLSKRN